MPTRAADDAPAPGPPRVPPRDEPVDAVVFDLFDTLVDLDFGHLPLVELGGRTVRSTYPALHAALREHAAVDFATFAAELSAVDREIAAGPHRRGDEVSTRERFARLAARLGREAGELAERLTAIHMAGIRAGARAPAGHVELLRRLRERRAIGICSNFTDARTALAILDEAGLLAHVDAVAISETVGTRKPRPEPFLAVLRDLGVAPARAVHVGDQLVEDVLGPTAVGMRSAWSLRRVRDAGERSRACPEARPTWTVAELAELERVLSRA